MRRRRSLLLAALLLPLLVGAAGYLIFRIGSPGEPVVARQTEAEVPGTITGIISRAPTDALEVDLGSPSRGEQRALLERPN